MSDLIAVMDHGRIVQLDTPRAIYFTPASEFVARFIGAANMLPGTTEAAVAAGTIGLVSLAGGVRIQAQFAAATPTGAAVQLAVRPESITLAAANTPAADAGNAIPAVLRSISFLGATVRCDVDAAGQTIRVSASAGPMPDIGAAISLHFPAQLAIALPA